MHEELRGDLAAYALGALSERRGPRASSRTWRMRALPRVRLWLRPAVDLLPASVEQLEPPQSLRESLMATVHAEAREADPLTASPPAATGPQRARRGWRGLSCGPATVLAAWRCSPRAGRRLRARNPGRGRTDATTVPVKAERPDDTVVASVEHDDGEDAILRVDAPPRSTVATSTRRGSSRGGEVEQAGRELPPAATTALHRRPRRLARGRRRRLSPRRPSATSRHRAPRSS